MMIDNQGTRGGPYRVYLRYDWAPGLAVSRAFGDLLAKEAGVISTPDVNVHHITHNDHFMVIGSDGVFEVMTNQEVVDIVAKKLESCLNQDGCLRDASELVVNEAQRRWNIAQQGVSCDDVTAMTILLQCNAPHFPCVHSR
mmetsp:Transcript_8057/g.23082  ORF Transcript_8057/g.23082 Transcript_8057/m.23082 type:complete len:141 (+) Transcript_8057:1075-1497(+)